MSLPYRKLAKDIEECSIVCRGCLATSGEMKNMHEWALVQDYFKLTGVQVHLSDKISPLLCSGCEEMLKKCKDFKAQCQQSDILLKDASKNSKVNTSPADDKTCSMSYEMSENRLNINIVALDTSDAKIKFACPYKSKCHQKFIKKRLLHLHMIKIHGAKDDFQIVLKYYCCHDDCAYSVKGDKHFTERKYLNQHYSKKHRNKVISCHECDFSCASISDYNRHRKVCGDLYICESCNVEYKMHERFLVHLKRKHPKLHESYKNERKAMRKAGLDAVSKKCDLVNGENGLKRSLATQTKGLDSFNKQDYIKDGRSTQTVSEDAISLRSESDLDSIFLSSVSDIQTQTFPLEFGTKSNKETLTSRSQSPDLSMKETQTCYCLYDSHNCKFEAMSAPSHLVSSETQTAELFCAMDLT